MDEYLMYLRKSRKDRDLELQTGNFDTLQRHRDALMALAKERGYLHYPCVRGGRLRRHHRGGEKAGGLSA